MAETWIRLLGPPRIESPGATPPQPRGRKSWAVLAYLALQPDGTSRSRTATLLFPDAADPLGALRWNLSELRRSLGGVSIAGDPLRLALLPPWRCDALELVGSATSRDIDPRRLDGQLLEGLSFGDSPVFDSWLADQRYRLENCVQSLLYEASLAALASGVPAEAVELSSQALRRDPFNADCTAVLVKALVAQGEHRRAREQVTKFEMPVLLRPPGSPRTWRPYGPISTPAARHSRQAPSTADSISCGSPSYWPSAPLTGTCWPSRS